MMLLSRMGTRLDMRGVAAAMVSYMRQPGEQRGKNMVGSPSFVDEPGPFLSSQRLSLRRTSLKPTADFPGELSVFTSEGNEA
jgi:hypothetical protein